MEKNQASFAFRLASKQLTDKANAVDSKNAKWQPRDGVSVAGCTYNKKYGEYTYSSTGDGRIFC